MFADPDAASLAPSLAASLAPPGAASAGDVVTGGPGDGVFETIGIRRTQQHGHIAHVFPFGFATMHIQALCQDAVPVLRIREIGIDGALTARIPPGTQSHTVLRLAGQGLPRFGGRGRGDLYLRVLVEIPKRLSDRERALYEELRAIETGGG